MREFRYIRSTADIELFVDLVYNMKKIKCLLCVLLFLISNSLDLSAQKLPNIQKEAVLLPSSAKVDGRLTEWKDALSAFQRSNQLQYTIANDSTRLYFAFRTRDPWNIAKIMAGGLSLMINSSGSKKDQGPEITFPMPNWSYSHNAQSVQTNFKILTDSIDIHNAILNQKEIKADRVKNISDSVLSVYNDYDIQTKLKYANQALVGELIIPLKLLEVPLSSSFSYNIKLNGVPHPPASASSPYPPPHGLPAGRSPSIYSEIRNPTDFWGVYVLKIK